MKTNTFYAKKVLVAFFAVLLPLVASAQTKVEIDGIWYNLITEAKTAEVTSSDGTKYSGSITIPATVTYDGVAYSVTSIGEWAFYYCTSLTAITIPEGVTSIGGEAFAGCSSLTAITIPENSQLTSIGEGAFYYCSSLTAITIPESVTSIGEGAFSGCSSLTAITIPEGVTSIGSFVFDGCSSLTAITCHAVTPPTIDSDTFQGVDKGIPVYVPAGSVEAYKEAKYWSEFTNYVGIEAGIDKSQLTTGSEQLTIYDLRGRRVDNPVKGGIYIVGGKKVIIK